MVQNNIRITENIFMSHPIFLNPVYEILLIRVLAVVYYKRLKSTGRLSFNLKKRFVANEINQYVKWTHPILKNKSQNARSHLQ